jgi:RNA polymerase sigma factor (sigma-70 family)
VGEAKRIGPRAHITDVVPMKTDAELLVEVGNDPEAFGELYRRHAVDIHGWFRVRVDERTAEDLTAETFAQAVLSLKRFRDEACGSAAPWLFGIAKNLHRRYQERRRVETNARRRLGMRLRSDDVVEYESVEERTRANRLRPDLGRALTLLPAGQRRGLELRVVEELPYAQVAETLGCSEGAARLRVMRALDSLTRRLNGAV